MPPRICLRHSTNPLRDNSALRSTSDPLTRCLVQSSSFSTSSPLCRSPLNQAKSGASGRKKGEKTLKLTKRVHARDAKPPAPGERKAIRKRIVLSNTNALEVPGLRDLTPQNVKAYDDIGSRVMGLLPDLVDSLRAVEAFKVGQGWGFFKRPAMLIRQEAVQIGRWMDGIVARDERLEGSGLEGDVKGKTVRRVIVGERKCGKSVLLLQAMANAFLRKWVVISLPEGRDIVNASTEYAPIPNTHPQQFTQPVYTANLLSQIAKANRPVLSQLKCKLQHDIPSVRIPKDITLDKLAELGSRDPEIAWPIFQALWKELMAPGSQAGEQMAPVKGSTMDPHSRPPVLLAADNLTHLLVPTAYNTLDQTTGKLHPIHPLDFTLIQHFMTYLSGTQPLGNGGIVLGAVCNSDGRRSDPLNVAQQMWDARQKGEKYGPLARELPLSEGSAEMQTMYIDTRIGGLKSLGPLPSPSSPLPTIKPQDQKLAEFWSPYKKLDMRIWDVLKGIEFMELGGMTREEARRIIEYWAGSGMVRRKVEEGWINERWTTSGGGVVGELERGVVRGGF